MSLKNLINQRVKSPSATVRFNGFTSRNIMSVDTSHDLNGAIATATVTTVTRPSVEPEGEVRITAGYNGQEQVVFTGLVDSIQRDQYSGTYTVSCRDLLKKAMDTFLVQEVKFGIDVDKQKYFYSTYTGNNGGEFTIHEYDSLSALTSNHPETAANYSNEGVKAHAVVQWLLIMSGLRESDQIRVEDANFWIGDISPAAFHLTSIFDSISQIAELIGWYVYCDPAGVVRFKKRPRMASGFTTWSYADSGSTPNILDVSHVRTNVDLRNYVEVHGASGIKVVERQGSPYLGTTPYRGVIIANELIDTSGLAKFMAKRVITDLNRLKETVSLNVEGNPYVMPGTSIEVRSAAANGVFLVETASSTLNSSGGYLTSIGATTFPGDITEEPESQIEAMFIITDFASLGDPRIVVQFDGSSSLSSRGPITSYSWDFAGNYNIYNTAGSSSSIWASFKDTDIKDGNSVMVSLTVRDGVGNIDTYASGITLEAMLESGQKMKYRHLYAALTTKAVATQDGGATWNMADCPAVSVAATNYQAGGVFTPKSIGLYGGSDGVIYKTEDYAKSITVAATLEGRINHVSIAELNALYCLACSSTGKVWKSGDGGTTWILIKDFGANVNVKQAEFGYENFDYITVVTGEPNPGAYVSNDGGVTWAQLTDFGNVTMNWYSAGSTTPYWAHGSGIVASRPQPDAIPMSEVRDIRGLTVALDDDTQIWAADTTGQHYVFENGTMQPTMMSSGLNTVRHMVRDGDMPIIGYYATTRGVYKTYDRNKTIEPLLDMVENFTSPAPLSPVDSVPAEGWGEMVAYGPLAPVVEPSVGRLLIHADDVLNTYDFQGYDSFGQPKFFLNPANSVRDGFYVSIASGLCFIEGINSQVWSQAAGPSYFVAITASTDSADPEEPESWDSGDVTPSFTFPPPNRLRSIVKVIDFTGLAATSGIIASGQFWPKFRTLPYSPVSAADIGTSTVRIDHLRIDPRPSLNYANRDTARMHVVYRLDGTSRAHSIDVPKFFYKDGSLPTNVGNSVGCFAGSEALNAPAPQLTRNVTSGGTVAISKWRGTSTRREERSILQFDESGTVTVTAMEIDNNIVTDVTYPQVKLLPSEGWVGFNMALNIGGFYQGKMTNIDAKLNQTILSVYGTGQLATPFAPLTGGLTSFIPGASLIQFPNEGVGPGTTIGGRYYPDHELRPCVNVCESAINPTDLYYATNERVYRLKSYGAVEAHEELWSIQSFMDPSWMPIANITYGTYHERMSADPDYSPGGRLFDPIWYFDLGICSFQVTHDRDHSKDYLTVVVGRSPGFTTDTTIEPPRDTFGATVEYQAWTSVDGGSSWELTKEFVCSTGGSSPVRLLKGAWWIDS